MREDSTERMVELAVTARRKFRGLMYGPQLGEVLVLAPCKDIHTVGMRRPIDVAFVDASGMVLESYRNVGRFRRLRCRNAAAVIERYARPRSDWFCEYDQLDLLRKPSSGKTLPSGGEGGR